jgi:hypothetical protein
MAINITINDDGTRTVVLSHGTGGTLATADEAYALWEKLTTELQYWGAPAIELITVPRDPDHPEQGTEPALRCPHCGTVSQPEHDAFTVVDFDHRENEAALVIYDNDGVPFIDVGGGDSDYATLLWRCAQPDCQRVVDLPLDDKDEPTIDVSWN